MSDQNLTTQILEYLKQNLGSKARKIAGALGADQKEVNSLLYGQLKVNADKIPLIIGT